MPAHRTVRVAALAGALALVLLGATACGSTASSSTAGSTTAGSTTAGSTTSTSQSNVRPGATYVALGSSFAASGPPPNSRDNCLRSATDYPHRIAASLRLKLADVSCDGATTSDILTQTQGSNPPQITAVTPTASLVTVTIGGNDINYLGSAFACSAAYATGGCSATVNKAQLSPLVDQLPSKLEATVRAIRSAAPHASIVLVTYPEIIPMDPSICPALHLTPEDANTIAWLGQSLEAASVQVAQQQGIVLADPYVLADGHGPCAPSGQAWVFGSTVTVSPSTGNFPFHPTDAGRAEMASLVESAIGG
jgi:lysophospholipase L1-like esterase